MAVYVVRHVRLIAAITSRDEKVSVTSPNIIETTIVHGSIRIISAVGLVA